MAAKRLVTVICLCVLAGFLLCSGAESQFWTQDARIFSRAVSARVFEGPVWTLPGRTAAEVGATLAGLQPSLVSGLLRLSSGDELQDNRLRHSM